MKESEYLDVRGKRSRRRALAMTGVVGRAMFWAILATVSTPPSILAQTAAVNARVAQVRDAAAKLKSFRVEILPPPSGEIAQSIGTGIFTWAAPHWHRFEVNEPVSGLGQLQRVTVCDGEIVWSYVPDLDGRGKRVAYKMDLSKLRQKWSDAELAARGVLLIADPFQGLDPRQIQFIGAGKSDGVECYRFEVPPPARPGMAQTVARMVLWVGAKDGIVREQETFSALGERLGRRQMKLLALDFEASAKDFSFTPPPGCDVVEVTEKVMKQLGE